ncbi:MAG: hypothetical protein RIR10_1451, partial [Planctomycetota bacterium]
MNANDPASIEARIRATETETAQLAGHARASRWSRRAFAACVASLLLAEV